MSKLKAVVENCGFENVSTYIQSGNVLFSSNKNTQQIKNILEKALSEAFKMNISVVVRSKEELRKIVDDSPPEWQKEDLRRYVCFVREPVTASEVEKEIQPREGVDLLKTGKSVLYMSTNLEGISKSGFTRLAAKKIYKQITIRNITTVEKLLNLLN